MIKFVLSIFCVAAACQAAHLPSRGTRIIGGSDATVAQFPFAAAIYKQTPTGTYFCGGSLFNNQHILTAGQCVDGATSFTVILGAHGLSENNPNSIKLSTNDYILHPNFNATTLANDIGIIRLRLPILYSDYIKPITMVTTTPLPEYSSVLTLGWGQISDTHPGLSDILQYVYLVTLTDTECKQVYGNQITESMVCVEGNNNEGTCLGDLGSPLIQYGGSSLIYQVGISSFLSSNGCESDNPSGFTRISKFVDWINTNAKN